MKTINRTTLFLILTFVITYLLTGIYKLSGGDITNRIGFTVLGAIIMFIPTISVIIVKKYIHHEKLKTDLLISFKINKWFFIAWLILPVIMLFSLGISLIFPDVIYSLEMAGFIKRFESMLTPEQIEQMRNSLATLPINPIWLFLLQGLIAGVTINAIAAFGEELGWRGFLLKEFKEMHFFKAAIIIGFIWGIWHAPLILMGYNYPQHPKIGVFMMIIFCILITPLLIYITVKSKSVIAAAILHGTMNGTYGISLMLTDGGNDLTVGLTGLSGFIALTVVLIFLFIYDYFISKEKILINKINNYL
ncbi:MAG: CPBP family intramembrane metalloprotease [Ignavibacteria bacterium]|nr:CPBP family intramembrane metalloprotease [Ignavibacteria bacterium]